MDSSWAVYLTLLLLCGYTMAQDTVINVDFDSAPRENEMMMLTVPPVSKIVFRSANPIRYTSGGNHTCTEGQGSFVTCTLALVLGTDNYKLSLDTTPPVMNSQARVINVKVFVNVIRDYVFGCSEYVFPVRLNVTANTGSLTCVPVFVNATRNASSILWFRSFTSDGVNKTRVTNDTVNFEDSEGVENATLDFHTASVTNAGYYFPMIDGVESNETPPILVTYQPQITSGIAEFSRELYIDPNFPQNTTFSCNVRSFPKASVIWRFSNINGTNLNGTLTCNQDTDRCYVDDKPTDVNDTYTYTLTIVNVDFANSGIYSCFPENSAIRVVFADPPPTNAHSYHLRVKDHLRPLWPAIGTLAVPLVLVLLMLVGTLWDKMISRYCFNEDSPSLEEKRRGVSTSTSSAGTPVQLTGSHITLRRISSANVQLLEEPGNI